jgi:hypothetical protein
MGFVIGVNERRWQALDYARLEHSTVSFFDEPKPETAASRWNRVSLNASKVLPLPTATHVTHVRLLLMSLACSRWARVYPETARPSSWLSSTGSKP